MLLSIIIPTANEAANISFLLDKIKEILKNIEADYEVIVADSGSSDNTLKIAQSKGAKVFIQTHPGYGGALKEAIALVKGEYIISLDADLSHNPQIIQELFLQRDRADILIASRYIKGGLADMPFPRYLLSIILNKFLSIGLALPVKDISSGFRLYRAEVFRQVNFSEGDFNVLLEILVKAYNKGFNIKEIPFHYQARAKGKSHARIVKFGIGFLRTFIKARREKKRML